MRPTGMLTARFTIFGAFRAGLGAAFRHPLQFAAIGLTVGVPLNVIARWMVERQPHAAVVPLDFAYIFLGTLMLWMPLALVHATAAIAAGLSSRGEPVALRTCFEQGFAAMPRLLPAMIWVTGPDWILRPIEHAMGEPVSDLEKALETLLLLLVLPVVVPIAAGERTSGLALFRRAWRLYKGRRRRGIGMVLLTVLVALIAFWLGGLLLDRIGVPSEAALGLLCLVWAFAAAPSAAAYDQRLRDKGGADLARVFD